MDALFDRKPPTRWERFISSPLLFFTQIIHTPARVAEHVPSRIKPPQKIRVVCISDTHNTHTSQPLIPEGDILIHAGDLTNSGTKAEMDDILGWMESQPHPHKVFIAGNHDRCLEDPNVVHYIISTYPGLTYLCESSTRLTIRGRSFLVYGAPYTPKNAGAFQYPRAPPSLYNFSSNPDNAFECTKIWSRIPPLTDILITHGPPFGHLDLCRLGCYSLLTFLWRVRPKAHVFGHIHAARGVETVRWDAGNDAYEHLCAGRVGWVGLVRLAYWTMLAWVRSQRHHQEPETIMVNAASVAGLKNEQRKGAIVIDI